jgi:hypothetical protein
MIMETSKRRFLTSSNHRIVVIFIPAIHTVIMHAVCDVPIPLSHDGGLKIRDKMKD